ncbi:hypothetical protein PoB_001477500 [Plakobranchus ocellatus]|uniref:Uncharacterized protein n=1 Tax=Plakobranchus ocellatus TaxID=259542 RepID=A0AAV3Z0U8_9GAST|nr:hypothetical protein PoB_001477500 [Plakobranchus ocellatus]
MYASQQPTTERVIVRSPDSGVFLLLLSFSEAISKPLIFDTSSRNNRRQLNINDLAATMPKGLRDAIIDLQVVIRQAVLQEKASSKLLKCFKEIKIIKIHFPGLAH